jgi:tetratricopeptide (TPR) repeat protein
MNLKVAVLLTLLLTTVKLGLAQEVQISQQPTVFETYPFSDPNPVPSLAYRPNIYPYFNFEGYSTKPEKIEWDLITMENDYLKITVMPQIGGRIWGAIEKSTGEDFIYENEVVKFRNIAMRGPWTSGGIEFNFGIIGHSPATASPVDYVYYENEDGSITCVVGTIDLPSRTQWRVKINLPKDKAYFETEGIWYNPEPLRQPYYNWMTAAAHVANDQEFYYPGHIALQHSGEVKDWPIQDGIAINHYKNNNFGGAKSQHIAGSFLNHFGGYFHNKGIGFGHFSTYDDSPGKKLWLWALSRNGGIWEDLLTDNDGQYMEFQAGRMLNQFSPSKSVETPLTKAGFAPYTLDQWSNYWFPVKDIGGISDVSKTGVVHVKQSDNLISLGFNPFQKVDGELEIFINGKQEQTVAVQAMPMEAINHEIKYDQPVKELEVIFAGEQLYKWTDNDEMKLSRPFDKTKAPQLSENQELYFEARQYYYSRNYKEARLAYEQLLENEPGHLQARIDYAELLLRYTAYEEALDNIYKALATDYFDHQANFVAGSIYNAMGQTNQALEAFGWAARSMEFRSSAYAIMSEIYLADGQLNQAVDFANKALQNNTSNIMALQVLAVSQRLKGEKAQALKTLDQLWEIDPLNHFIRFEHYLLDKAQSSLEKFKAMIKNEMPFQSYLELATVYNKYKQKEIAIQVLENSPKHPLVNLWLAYLDPAQKEEQLNQMITQPSAFVLPFRKETLPMLKWAKSEISSWKVDYYLALNLMALGQEEEGHQLIEAIGQSADEATFYLSRALLLDQQEDKKKQEDLEKALSMDQSQWRTWFQLTKHFDNIGENQKALSLVKEAVKAFPGNYVLEMEYIQLLNQAGQYKTAMKLLDKIEVLPHEGAGGGRTLYESVYLNATLQDIKAKKWNAALTKIEKSRLWPENLGVGKPYNPKEILQDYLTAMVYKARNEQSKSRDYLEAVIAQADKVNINSQEQALVLLAMKNNGQKAAAAELIEKIKKEGKAASVVKIEQLIDYAESSESAPSDLENDKGIVKRIIEAF